ncbi:trypsin-like serine peptidase [Hoeflea poritis]|uniref:Serine protease n=1 Tax=Hoeflea poritis TaxID=2993659 RepID=A0ABT4VXU7_9HYPH|nr:serine protease [Hoeflea poritis]MDA4848828.1 serine protease [Hoeflea poritis]
MAITPEDLGLSDIRPSLTRIHAIASKFRKAKQMIAKGRGREADSSERRVKAELRQMEMERLEAEQEPFLIVTPGFGQEAHIGERNNILSGEFLEIGILAARAVCKITRGAEVGTGFLVGEGVVITNHHVIASPEEAAGAVFEFLFDDNTIGTPRNAVAYVAEPERFFLSNENLDFCFVALREADGFPPLSSFGWLPLLRDEGKILIGDPVNIIQHPRGQQKRVVVHDSTFVMVDDESDADAFCWYSGDTDKGSSGAPVMNSRWEIVALHHKAIPATDKNGHVLDVNGKTIAEGRANDPDVRIKWIANEGVRASRLVAQLHAADLPATQGAVRSGILALWNNPMATLLARQASFQGMQAG